MIACRTDGNAVLVPVRAQPRAARNRIAGEHAGALKVAVTQPPDRGRANDAIGEILASALGLRPSAVRLVSGAASRAKIYRIEGATPADINRLLQG